MQLRRVVEMAGMDNHISFDEQATTDTGRPDMVIYMPNAGVIPVDAKVPLEAYLEASETIDVSASKEKLEQHAKAVQGRVRELGLKKYWEQFEQSPDFVVMFIPNEACLGAAFEQNPGLFEYAIDQKVLITTPVTLLALLKAVAYGWQQNQMAENAQKIAAEGKELHSRFGKFLEHVANLNGHLTRSVEAYNQMVGSLERRVFPSLRRLEGMGVAGDGVFELPESVDTTPRLPDSQER